MLQARHQLCVARADVTSVIRTASRQRREVHNSDIDINFAARRFRSPAMSAPGCTAITFGSLAVFQMLACCQSLGSPIFTQVPASYFQIGEVGLPELVRRCRLVLELIHCPAGKRSAAERGLPS